MLIKKNSMKINKNSRLAVFVGKMGNVHFIREGKVGASGKKDMNWTEEAAGSSAFWVNFAFNEF